MTPYAVNHITHKRNGAKLCLTTAMPDIIIAVDISQSVIQIETLSRCKSIPNIQFIPHSTHSIRWHMEYIYSCLQQKPYNIHSSFCNIVAQKPRSICFVCHETKCPFANEKKNIYCIWPPYKIYLNVKCITHCNPHTTFIYFFALIADAWQISSSGAHTFSRWKFQPTEKLSIPIKI